MNKESLTCQLSPASRASSVSNCFSRALDLFKVNIWSERVPILIRGLPRGVQAECVPLKILHGALVFSHRSL